MADFQIDLTADFYLVFHEGVQGGKYSPFNGIFYRDNAKGRAASFNLGKNILYGFNRLIIRRVAEVFYSCQMGICCFRTKIGHHGPFL